MKEIQDSFISINPIRTMLSENSHVLKNREKVQTKIIISITTSKVFKATGHHCSLFLWSSESVFTFFLFRIKNNGNYKHITTLFHHRSSGLGRFV